MKNNYLKPQLTTMISNYLTSFKKKRENNFKSTNQIINFQEKRKKKDPIDSQATCFGSQNDSDSM